MLLPHAAIGVTFKSTFSINALAPITSKYVNITVMKDDTFLRMCQSQSKPSYPIKHQMAGVDFEFDAIPHRPDRNIEPNQIAVRMCRRK